MAILFDGPVTPNDLTTFVRTIPSPADQVLDRILPDRFIRDHEVSFQELTRTNRTARFRAFDGRLHVSERDVISGRKVKLPPLSSSLNMGEYERLQLEFTRTQGTNIGALADAIYNDADILTREVLTRMEQARGDVLLDGKFTLAGEGGLYLEADFGVPGSHIVAPGTLWSNTATSTPLTDIQTWVDVYVGTNGFPPGSFITSNRVLRYLLRNTEVVNAVAGSAAGRTRVTGPELSSILGDYLLPGLNSTYDTLIDVDGVSTRVIPDDRVIFLPPNPADLGYTAWGITATALELMNAAQVDMSFSRASGVVGVVEKVGPPYRQFTYVDAVGMPILTNPKLLMVADVA